MNPSVSVIIPAWNAESTIGNCLHTLKQQTVPPFEIILVDDGSSDATVTTAASHEVIMLDTGGRKGPATARNLGAEKATGEILLFLDSDVTIPEDLLEKVQEHFSDQGVWAVQTLYTPVCPAEDTVSRYQNYYYWYSLYRMSSRAVATFATWCAAVRRERFLELGGFNVRIPEPTVEDEELGYTIADRGGRIVLDKTLLVTHLARYDLNQFTRRRLRMARAQAKSGWREIRNRLLARYMNVRESGTHHSRWVVLSILLVLIAQVLLAAAVLKPVFAIPAALAILASVLCHRSFLFRASKEMGRVTALKFSGLCVYDMAVLGWGILHGTLQYASGRRY